MNATGDRRVIPLEKGWGFMQVRAVTTSRRERRGARSERTRKGWGGASRTERLTGWLEFLCLDETQEGIMKLRRLLDEKDSESFTSEEYMNLYTYVFAFDADETL